MDRNPEVMKHPARNEPKVMHLSCMLIGNTYEHLPLSHIVSLGTILWTPIGDIVEMFHFKSNSLESTI